ncbi:hypothetical protein NAF17_11765 [Mucilaginibacter sp. RB4R14]|uniref:hypothetical protein n=1 Tax=Mucilaginibacter aurantiaciroseus TaxID=2949308 RepID=UPI002090D030|nr:hypothetical protein [Mucilaginibacter aurantiaciroseus]MCO5936215.1 hypothetical protein [Mucilaginibacter aurantiaciroseus]
MKSGALAILMLSALFSCKQKAQNDIKIAVDTAIKTDTASLRKLLENSQKQDVEIPEMLFNADTLKIVTGISHLYYPFGRHGNIQEIKKAITNKVVKDIHLSNIGAQDSTSITQITTSKSIVKFYKSDETNYQEIISADIRDSNFHFLNNIRVGMSKDELLKILFNKPPAVTVNTIKLISILDGIQHYYIFKDDKLIEIKMVTDYMFEGK